MFEIIRKSKTEANGAQNKLTEVSELIPISEMQRQMICQGKTKYDRLVLWNTVLLGTEHTG